MYLHFVKRTYLFCSSLTRSLSVEKSQQNKYVHIKYTPVCFTQTTTQDVSAMTRPRALKFLKQDQNVHFRTFDLSLLKSHFKSDSLKYFTLWFEWLYVLPSSSFFLVFIHFQCFDFGDAIDNVINAMSILS